MGGMEVDTWLVGGLTWCLSRWRAAVMRRGGARSMRGLNVPQRGANTHDAGVVPPKVRYEPRERRLNSIHFLFESPLGKSRPPSQKGNSGPRPGGRSLGV